MKTVEFITRIEGGKVTVPESYRGEEGSQVKVILLLPTPQAGPPARSSSAQQRELGQDRGLFVVPDNFDDPLPEEILRSFEG